MDRLDGSKPRVAAQGSRHKLRVNREKTMGRRAANASGSQWISRDGDGKGNGHQ
jgi:hypothetical protein